MKNSTLISLLKSFSDAEMRRFEDFIYSPFFNKSKKVIELFIYLKKFKPDYEDGGLEKENIYAALYPKKKYNYGILKNVQSELYVLGEKFLQQLNLENYRFDQLIFLTEILRYKNLNTAIERNIKLMENELDKSIPTESSYFYNKYRLESQKYHHAYNLSKTKLFPNKDYSFENFLSAEEYLNKFFLTESLDFYDLMLNITLNSRNKYKMQFEDLIKKYYKHSLISESPDLIMRVYRIKLLSEDATEKLYFDSKKLLDKYENLLKANNIFCHNYFMALLNFCKKMTFTEKEEKYLKESFELYKKIIEFDVYSYTKYFPVLIFRNIFVTSISLKEFDWSESFFNEYKTKIAPENLDLEEQIYNSIKHFETAQFDKSLESLSTVEFGNDYNKILIKVITMKNVYELKRFLELPNAIDSFKHFLSYNQNFPLQILEPHSNFIKFFEKLVQTILDNKKAEVKYLIKLIKEEKYVANRKWLLEKACKLLKP